MNLDIVQTSRTIAGRPPSQLTGDELSAVLDAAVILESYISQAKAEAERRIESSDGVPGWELAPGRGRTSIVDTPAAFRALAPLLTERAFLDCCTAVLGKLTEAVRVAEGVTEDDAKDILGDYLRGNLIKSEGTPTLKRTPKIVEIIPLPPTDKEAA
jgi:hypothetical protein